ncbi:DUF6009 family protein [Streptomyces sp. NBC_00986]|uniref:DUF6009 family protein n=1 Tax=Streptomyces sp. NBC_00986 TaxID=2903702 RepID=UPI003862D6F3|nr:DUF6009 family protein [Streptomyces sp. NBC_00986]WSX65104.1 DUF6009 family protein [Streptomyces sp. NBC_00986]
MSPDVERGPDSGLFARRAFFLLPHGRDSGPAGACRAGAPGGAVDPSTTEPGRTGARAPVPRAAARRRQHLPGDGSASGRSAVRGRPVNALAQNRCPRRTRTCCARCCAGCPDSSWPRGTVPGHRGLVVGAAAGACGGRGEAVQAGRRQLLFGPCCFASGTAPAELPGALRHAVFSRGLPCRRFFLREISTGRKRRLAERLT